MKRCNFPGSLGFEDEIVAIFLIRSHFLSIYKNMTINNSFPMGLFKKYVITLREFYFITSPVLFTKNNKLLNHRKEDFLYIWLFQCVKLYQRK